MFISRSWKDYELIDASRGEKLERWGGVILRRPDPQIVWSVPDHERSALWNKADARYIRSAKGGGSWRSFKKIPESWTISYKNLKFRITPMLQAYRIISGAGGELGLVFGNNQKQRQGPLGRAGAQPFRLHGRRVPGRA